MSSLRQCVDKRFRYLLHLNTLIFSTLRPLLSKPSCSEDALKVGWNRDLGKVCNSDLSTFGRITCGGQWTTQPLVALHGNQQMP